MRLSLGLEQRQVQVQKLAPRMIQSMEILQLPILALQERIEQEMNENPVLERTRKIRMRRKNRRTGEPRCSGRERKGTGRRRTK